VFFSAYPHQTVLNTVADVGERDGQDRSARAGGVR
jgi:hypothetical protein